MPSEWADLLADFLASKPPGQSISFSPDWDARSQGCTFQLPDVRLYCSKDACDREQFFHPIERNIGVIHSRSTEAFKFYSCRNCGLSSKTFALRLTRQENEVECLKIGEFPPFGPNTPGKLINLIGPDRDLFLKGRRAEALGLGIGAHAYYRRVVENQKNRIFDKIIEVAKRTGAPTAFVEEMEAAKNETQFTKAVDVIRSGLPDGLKIDGHSPLKLLHGALSEGLHAADDAECLSLAQDIRVLLTALAERMAAMLKDDAEVHQAVSRLLRRGQSGAGSQPPA